MTFTELVFASAIGQGLVVGAVGVAYALLWLMRVLNEVRLDLAEMRRRRAIERARACLARTNAS